tara:strand:- start:1277 stop:1564 length:288 start_codon:yes stop_codon:yes gene_type:complete
LGAIDPDQPDHLARLAGVHGGRIQFPSARIAGLDTVGSYLVHALFAVAALTIFLRHFVRRRHLRSLPLSTTDILVFTLATALMSPYVHNLRLQHD